MAINRDCYYDNKPNTANINWYLNGVSDRSEMNNATRINVGIYWAILNRSSCWILCARISQILSTPIFVTILDAQRFNCISRGRLCEECRNNPHVNAPRQFVSTVVTQLSPGRRLDVSRPPVVMVASWSDVTYVCTVAAYQPVKHHLTTSNTECKSCK